MGKSSPAKREQILREVGRNNPVGKNKRMIVDTGSSVEGILMPATRKRVICTIKDRRHLSVGRPTVIFSRPVWKA